MEFLLLSDDNNNQRMLVRKEVRDREECRNIRNVVRTAPYGKNKQSRVAIALPEQAGKPQGCMMMMTIQHDTNLNPPPRVLFAQQTGDHFPLRPSLMLDDLGAATNLTKHWFDVHTECNVCMQPKERTPLLLLPCNIIHHNNGVRRRRHHDDVLPLSLSYV